MTSLREKLENFRRIARDHGHLPLELEAAEAFIDVALAAEDVDRYRDLTEGFELRAALQRLDEVMG